MAGCGFGQWILFLRIIIEIIETGKVVGLLIVRAARDLFEHHLPIATLDAEEVVADVNDDSLSIGLLLPAEEEVSLINTVDHPVPYVHKVHLVC